MRVELLHAPGCPNAEAARRVVLDCLAGLGVAVPVVERVGRYRSPTVLVDDVDVMSSADGRELVGDACRLELPTAERVLAVMRASLSRDAEAP